MPHVILNLPLACCVILPSLFELIPSYPQSYQQALIKTTAKY
jgi:hypothetical protein